MPRTSAAAPRAIGLDRVGRDAASSPGWSVSALVGEQRRFPGRRTGHDGLGAVHGVDVGLTYGPPLILATAVPEQVMVVHPGIVVADMLANHYTHLIQSQQPTATVDPELEEETS